METITAAVATDEVTNKKTPDEVTGPPSAADVRQADTSIKGPPSAADVRQADTSIKGSPSATNQADTTDEHQESSESDDASDISLGSWEYIQDPAYTVEEVPFSASQPCGNVRGVSYTPPGWIRKYRKRVHTDEPEPPAAKKINLNLDK